MVYYWITNLFDIVMNIETLQAYVDRLKLIDGNIKELHNFAEILSEGSHDLKFGMAIIKPKEEPKILDDDIYHFSGSNLPGFNSKPEIPNIIEVANTISEELGLQVCGVFLEQLFTDRKQIVNKLKQAGVKV